MSQYRRYKGFLVAWCCAVGTEFAIDFISKREKRYVFNTVRKNRANEDVADDNDFATTLRCDAKRYLLREHTKSAGRVSCADGHKLAIDVTSKREERCVFNTVRKNRANKDIADGNEFATTLRCNTNNYFV